MELNFMFFLNSVLFGLGLAMDAFSVSLANGLAEPNMRRPKLFFIAGIFAFFQGAMPLIGWGCIHTVVLWFSWIEGVIPWISLLLLSYIGGKMLWEALHKESGISDESLSSAKGLGLGALILQGVATSIDALSVGFTIADYTFVPALLEALIIMAVTFLTCALGVHLGTRFGTRLAHRAEIFGGVLLILIGVEIFLSGIF